MFVNKINSAIKTLTTEPNMRFHSKNHMIQLIMYASGMPMCTESFKEVESYLEDGAEAILRDFGVHHG